MPVLTIGVLALQGAFVEHVALLRRAAADSIPCGQQCSQHRTSGSQIHDRNGNGDEEEAQRNQPHNKLNNNDSGPDGLVSRRNNAPCACSSNNFTFDFVTVRTPEELAICSALVIPGGESTSIALIAARTGLLDPLRDFVKVQRRPVWGTCAGLILLAESADRTKATGQELIGGLDVRVRRNYFGRQVESFTADLQLPFLLPQDHVNGDGECEDVDGAGETFHAVFIRAPVVESILPLPTSTNPSSITPTAMEDTVTAPPRQPTTAPVEILARLPGRAKALKDATTTAADLGEEGDIVAVRQGNVFGTAFHPELTGDARIHRWWLAEVVKAVVGTK